MQLCLLSFAVIKVAVAWLIYPFFARQIVENNYLLKGWVRLLMMGESNGV
jgi:hypothetical protein